MRAPLNTLFAAAAIAAVSLTMSASAAPGQAKPDPAKPATRNPIVVLDTVKGMVEFELFAAEAPKSVAHILDLVRRHFYRGLRVHRVTPGLVQWGDPRTRDVSQRAYWGSGGSGRAINEFELSKKRQHIRGVVGLAHSGNPFGADSQLYILKTPSPGLNGKHAIIGQVVQGMAVVDRLQEVDLIKVAYVKGEAPK